jgi:hypothetical protein
MKQKFPNDFFIFDLYVQSRPSKSERLLAKISVFFVRLNQAVFIGVRAAGVNILIIKTCNNKNETKK